MVDDGLSLSLLLLGLGPLLFLCSLVVFIFLFAQIPIMLFFFSGHVGEEFLKHKHLLLQHILLEEHLFLGLGLARSLLFGFSFQLLGQL